MIKKILSIITIAILPIHIIAITACGIANAPVLNEVGVDIPIRGVFSITHNTGNQSDSFLGYNVYYKFYRDGNSGLISNDKSFITSATNPTPSTITSRGFRQFVPTVFNGISFSSFNDDASDVLLSPRPKNSAKIYYIDFSGGINVGSTLYSAPANLSSYTSGFGDNIGLHALLIDGSSTTILQRRMSGNGGFLPFFNTTGTYKYAAADNDIKSMVPDFVAGDSLAIVIAVIPFGIDFTNLQRVYGKISVSFSTSFNYTLAR